jgi:hypothetical protein
MTNRSNGSLAIAVAAASHQLHEESMELANVFSSIASGWNQLGEILHTARLINAKSNFNEGMDAAVILAILGKNMNVHGTTEIAMDIARVASKCVQRRQAGCTHLSVGWHMSLEKSYRVFYCISDQGIRRILSPSIHHALTMVPLFANQLGQAIRGAVEEFYLREFHEPIEDLDCFLVVSVIQEKFQEDDDEDEEETAEEHEEDGNNAAPAA